MDAEARFNRLLELPTELRCGVYEHLLDLGPWAQETTRTCFPQILCTSKQVHQEAEDALYANNQYTIQICVNQNVDHHNKVEQNVFIYGDRLLIRHRGLRLLKRIHTTVPESLRKVQHLNIAMRLAGSHQQIQDLTNAQSGASFEAAHYYLYSLCSILVGDNKLRNLDLHVQARSIVSLDQVAEKLL
jgi:hypothetical protein